MACMKILITGINGAVGWNLANRFNLDGNTVFGTFRSSPPPEIQPSRPNPGATYFPLDLGNPHSLKNQLDALPEDIDSIIHCAAMTDVNLCEHEETIAYLINSEGTRLIADLAKKRKIFLIYLSTDFVFPGNHECYQEDSEPSPQGIYGKSKLEGEKYVLDLKDSAVIRFTPLDHPLRLEHHSKTLVSWLKNHQPDSSPIRLFDDKTFSPVSSFELYELCNHILNNQNQSASIPSGIWHCCSREILSVFEMGMIISRFYNLPIRLEKSSFPDNEYGQIRPKNSGLRSTRYPSKTVLKILSQFDQGSN